MDLVRRLASVREQTLDRLIRIGFLVAVVGIGVVGVVYVLDRRAGGGPSLVDRRISTAEDAVRKHPNNVGLRLQLAEIYRVANKPDSALEQYQEVLKVDPGQRTGLLGRGEILADQGELATAAESFKKVIEGAAGGEFAGVDPQLESAYYGLGSVALKQGHAKAAIAALDKALKVDPTDADALQLMAAASLKVGAPNRAVKALRQAIQLVPTGWCDPYKLLTEAYRTLNRRARAEYAGAMVDFCEKRPDDAARRLEPLTSGPAAVDAMLGLGMIAEAESDRASAIRWYRRVIAADASNSTARIGLNRLGVATRAGVPHSSLPAARPPSGEAG